MATSASLRDRITIVLVEPLFAGNIGSACRAMKNMGLHDLRMVHPPLDRKEEASRMAHGALDVLENARRVFTLEEALEDVQFVVGTTARLGGWREQIQTPRQAAGKIMEIAASNKVAILFGSEDRGLSNEAIKRCNMLISVPTSKQQRSLNLAQAVLLIAYELYITEFEGTAKSPGLAASNQVEGMFQDLSEALELIHFLRPGNPEYWMMAFKRLFGRSGLTTPEVNMLRGVCRQIRWVHSLVDQSIWDEKERKRRARQS